METSVKCIRKHAKYVKCVEQVEPAERMERNEPPEWNYHSLVFWDMVKTF